MNIFTYTYSPNPDTDMTNNITPELAAALVAAINEAGTSVVADAQNPFHKNSYATLGAHLTATKEVFAKHGLAIVQFPHGDGNQVGVNTMVIHKDGGYIQNYVTLPVGEGVKGQDAGSLFSYLRRYAIAAVAGLATTDDDAEADRIVRTAAPAPAAKAAAAIAGARAAIAAAPAAKVVIPAGDIDPSMVLPFGRNKGQQIGSLSHDDLGYWANTWEPRPFEKTGRVSEKDLKLKRTAVALYANASGAPADAGDATPDDVPF